MQLLCGDTITFNTPGTSHIHACGPHRLNLMVRCMDIKIIKHFAKKFYSFSAVLFINLFIASFCTVLFIYLFSVFCFVRCLVFFFFKQKTAYEIVSRDWSSDVCSSDLPVLVPLFRCLILDTRVCRYDAVIDRKLWCIVGSNHHWKEINPTDKFSSVKDW